MSGEANGPLRVAIWCAVSSRQQAGPDKASLDEQERAGHEFAEALGGHVVATYRVPGHSRDYVLWAEAEAEMDAYRRLREDCEEGVFDVLHAVDPDRLGRTAALIHQAIGLVERGGAEVYFASSPHLVGQRATSRLYMHAILAARADEAQEIRRRRHRMGMRRRVKRGLTPTRWPYGYRVVRDSTGRAIGGEFVEEELAALRLMTRLFLQGESYYEIARELTAAGYPPPGGDKWYFSTITSMTKNDVYAGLPVWGDVHAEEPTDRYPILWDEETYKAILQERRYRANNRSRRVSSPLHGVVFCARCGKPTHRCPSPHRVYQRCSTHRKPGETCHRNTTPEDDIWDALLKFLAGLTDLEALREQISRDSEDTETKRQLQELEERRQDIAQQRQRLAYALAQGAMDPLMYRRTDDGLVSRLNAIERERAQVEELRDARPSAEDRIAALEDLRASLAQRFEDMPGNKLNALLRHAGIRVECEDRHVVAIRIE